MILKPVSTLKDIEIIKSLFYSVFPEKLHYDFKKFYDSINKTHQYSVLKYYIAYENSEPIGFCGEYSDNPNEVWLGCFGIKPDKRHHGYAKQMLTLLVNSLYQDDYHTIRVYTNKKINGPAHKLYESFGFREDSQYQHNIITMVKDIVGKANNWSGMPLGFESESYC